MYLLQKYIKKIIYASTAVAGGILLFILLLGFNVERNSLNPDFHSALFKKYDIYSGTQYVISSSMSGFIENLKKNNPEVYEQQKEVISLLDKNLTTDLIVKNLDSLREGLFEYLKDDRKFLPDIFLSTQSEQGQQPAASENSGENSPSQALSKISKVNLGAVLMYMGRTDIVDYLSVLKLVYYIITSLPGILLPCFLLLFLIGLALFRKFTDVVKWLSTAIISCGILEILTGVGLLIFKHALLPNYIYPITMTLSLGNEPALAYLKDCINSVSVFLTISGIVFILISSAALAAPRFFPSVFVWEGMYAENKSQKLYYIIRNSLYGFCLVILFIAIGYRVFDVRKDFIANDFLAVVTKMKGVATVTQVISAKDAAIYDVQLKVVDEKNGKPVENAEINIIGKSTGPKADFNETKPTNEKGEVKFSLDKGSFRLTFLPSSFPAAYKMPAPYFFDLKAAGTKVITISLEDVPEVKPKWGFAEIEVLDEDNNPVPNLELAVLGIPFAPGYPDKVFAYTNAEGIAVFKLNEGSYKVNFTESKLPQKYHLPSNIEVTINSNTLSRYTLRLVEKPEHKSTPSPSPWPGH